MATLGTYDRPDPVPGSVGLGGVLTHPANATTAHTMLSSSFMEFPRPLSRYWRRFNHTHSYSCANFCREVATAYRLGCFGPQFANTAADALSRPHRFIRIGFELLQSDSHLTYRFEAIHDPVTDRMLQEAFAASHRIASQRRDVQRSDGRRVRIACTSIAIRWTTMASFAASIWLAISL
jgi:hypothetical protein